MACSNSRCSCCATLRSVACNATAKVPPDRRARTKPASMWPWSWATASTALARAANSLMSVSPVVYAERLVPPLVSGRMPETSAEARLTALEEKTPAAEEWRIPVERDDRVSPAEPVMSEVNVLAPATDCAVVFQRRRPCNRRSAFR